VCDVAVHWRLRREFGVDLWCVRSDGVVWVICYVCVVLCSALEVWACVSCGFVVCGVCGVCVWCG
jgi:hypothetical protein